MDNRMVARLEEQLRDAHAANVKLRERVSEAERIERQADTFKAES